MQRPQTAKNHFRYIPDCGPTRIDYLLGINVEGRPSAADDWPQWLGPARDGVWREKGIVSSFPASGPVFRWQVPIGAGYASPPWSATASTSPTACWRLREDPASAFARNMVDGK